MTKRLVTRMVIMVVCVVALVGVLAFIKFSQFQKFKAQMSVAPPPVAVTAIKAQKQEWQPQLNGVGSLRAVRGVDVTTEIAGLVRSVNFKSGQEVKTGEVLVQLNADSDLGQLHSLQAAADLAVTVLHRDQEQLAVDAIAKAQVDFDAADLKSKRAQVAQQQAVVDKKTIRAPFAGRVGITLVNPGQYLNPGDKVVSLQTINPIYIDFYLPQQQISGVALGQSVTVTNDAYAGRGFAGKITATDSKVDTNTRNVQVEATIQNPKGELLPGMFGRAAVDSGERRAYLTLPQTAITYNPYGATVFVAENGTSQDKAASGTLHARQVFVTTGATRGDQVAITKGIEEGALVVTSGQLKLKNGTPLRIDDSVVPLDAAHPTPQEH